MLNDIESNVDYLNFKIVADPVAQMIKQGDTKPISIGVSGNWGSGKSSMVRMIAESLKSNDTDSKYEVVSFNAWLYQGYDDARLALLQHVADHLETLLKDNKTAYEKFKEFLSRIDWFKTTLSVTPMIAKTAIGAMSLGPIGAILAGCESVFSKVKEMKPEDIPSYLESCGKALPNIKSYIKETTTRSMPKEIEALRASFQETLKQLDVRLVIVVDDLDRCLPDVALSTLEAMRLLLMVDRTIFVIAADDIMIRQAVRSRYGSEAIDNDRETSYFDKLIQIPVRVPRPGPNEVKCYIMMLLAELAVQQGRLSEDVRQSAATFLCDAIKKSWAGKLTRAVLSSAFGSNASAIDELIDIADQVSGIMTSSHAIGGNPRLIKRFLNNLMIRKAVSDSQGMGLSFLSLVKLQLFERCAPPGAFDKLAEMVANSDDGCVPMLNEWEKSIVAGKSITNLPDTWEPEFVSQWIGLKPELGNVDLRPYIYLSQEDKRRFEPNRDFSPKGRNVMKLLCGAKSYQTQFISVIQGVDEVELTEIFERMKERVRAGEWKSHLQVGLLHLPKAAKMLTGQYVTFMENAPRDKVSTAIIPVLVNEPWAKPLMERWASGTDALAKRIQSLVNGRRNS